MEIWGNTAKLINKLVLLFFSEVTLINEKLVFRIKRNIESASLILQIFLSISFWVVVTVRLHHNVDQLIHFPMHLPNKQILNRVFWKFLVQLRVLGVQMFFFLHLIWTYILVYAPIYDLPKTFMLYLIFLALNPLWEYFLLNFIFLFSLVSKS